MQRDEVWLKTATAGEVVAAQEAGELDHLLGRDVSKEAARLEAVAAHVRDTIVGAL
jgi:hypothetical protein